MANREHSEYTRDDIWSMLGAIDAYDRGDWLKIGMAIKSYLGDSGFSLFDDWSRTADNYKTADVRRTWRSFRGSGIGIGSLVRLARQSGYNNLVQTTTAPTPRAAPQKQSSTKAYAAELWLAANKWVEADDWLAGPSPDESVISHPYSIAKGITSAGGAARGIASGSLIGKNADCLIVPIREHGDGNVIAVECINPAGSKQTFGPKEGGYLLLGNTLDISVPWYVCEGWASGYSAVFHWPNRDGSKRDNSVCAISFGKGNLDRCADQVEQHHGPNQITIHKERD